MRMPALLLLLLLPADVEAPVDVAAGVAAVHQRPPRGVGVPRLPAPAPAPRRDGRDLRGVELVVGEVPRGLGHVRPRVGAGELGAVVAGHVEQPRAVGVAGARSLAPSALVAAQTRVYRSQAA